MVLSKLGIQIQLWKLGSYQKIAKFEERERERKRKEILSYQNKFEHILLLVHFNIKIKSYLIFH